MTRTVPLTLRPNVIVDTGRVSYDGVVQLFPRKGGYRDRQSKEWVPSLRECIVARPGYVFSSEDYTAGELFTHAQSCLWLLGYSDLAKTLLAGINPHAELASRVLGIAYEQFDKKIKQHADTRQAAKPVVFGKPGGMGDAKMVIQQRSQGPDTPCPDGPSEVDDGNGDKVPGYTGLRFCVLMNGARRCGEHPDGRPNRTTRWGGKYSKPIAPTCVACLECAAQISRIWKDSGRENQPYFNLVEEFGEYGMTITPDMIARWPWIGEWYEPGQQLAPGQVMQHWSGRLRGGLDFCDMANGFFQALLADATKSALRRIVRECYVHTIVPEFAHENSRRSQFAGCPSPLLGSRAIGFFHDELFMEHPESIAHEAATRVSEIMVEELVWICPDVGPKVSAEPTLMRRWSKSAEKVTDANGRLIPWEPRIAA